MLWKLSVTWFVRAGETSHGKKLETAVQSNLSVIHTRPASQLMFRDTIEPLHAQNGKLRAARDLLLPRLIGGEIAI